MKMIRLTSSSSMGAQWTPSSPSPLIPPGAFPPGAKPPDYNAMIMVWVAVEHILFIWPMPNLKGEPGKKSKLALVAGGNLDVEETPEAILGLIKAAEEL